MNEYSENWQHLKAILAGYAKRDRDVEVYSYEEQRQAKALSIFLANAELATPMLDRETVAAVLAGTLQWPRSSGAPFTGTGISLSQLERWGLVSFYAGWCTTHIDTVRDLSAVDPSLLPLIEAVNHLKDIRYGRNGCIQPHFTCTEAELRQLLHVEFGDHLTVEQLLTELELRDGLFTLAPGNQNFSSLISTHLWLILRNTQTLEVAFSRWMMCFRVNCEWAMPVIFDQQQHEERKEFNGQLLMFLAEDDELARDVDFYIKQSVNEENFSGRIRPMEFHHKFFDEEGSRSDSIRMVELPKPTLSSLDDIYQPKAADAKSNLEFTVNFNSSRMRGRSELFYSWLISSTVDASIRIQGQQLISSGFTEDLVTLAENRPILKYILFIALPVYEHSNYILLLLAYSKTSDVALYYLAKQTFEYSRSSNRSHIHNLENWFQQLVCLEYVRSVEKEPDFIPRVLSILKFLGEQCAFRTTDFSKGFEYRFLLNLLNTLEHQQVVQLAQVFTELPARIEGSRHKQLSQHYRYLLGFWLIDRLESSGIDPTGATCRALRESIQAYYGVELAANLEGLSSLEPSAFFATLPWNKLIAETGPGYLLTLSNRCDEWKQSLAYTNPHSFGVAAALSQYLQILMCLGRPTPLSGALHGVAARVQEIVRSCGFGTRESFANLFGEMPDSNKYDLWEDFCSYSNSFRDELYEEFVARCVPSIPLDHLFVLLENCAVIARARLLHDAIDARQFCGSDDLGLTGLEQAFASACDSGRTETAVRLLESAKEILAQKRFANSSDQYIVRIRNTWQSYEYKWQLLGLYEANKANPASFQKIANELPIPHERKIPFQHSPDRSHYDDCEHFRRQLIAMAFSDADPSKSVQVMDALYRQTKQAQHGFVLLYGHLKLHAVDKDNIRLQHALAYFLNGVGSVEPEQMSESWVTTILEAYRLIGSPEIDGFWMRLSAEQHTRLKILTPYCSALIARGDAFMARKVLARYQQLNQSTPDELGIDDLITELSKVEAELPSMKDLVQLLNEGSQRSILQLQKHYAQVVAKDFETYVEIVRPDQLSHDYLKDAVLAVAHELVLRKRNLQVEKTAKGKTSYQIMLEDLINDWFTSLFDHRMAQARVGFRDQKRGGHSASGKSPGEIDAFITSNDNKRIALFEAFRLFSLDTKVISEHLDKIAGYDAESLSPVFMVGYCDVKGFSDLVKGYGPYISKKQYIGYTVTEDSPAELTVLCDTDHIWLAKETRRRDRKDIFFYHLLINLHFSPPLTTTLENGKPDEQMYDVM